jgi:hypothetical protein
MRRKERTDARSQRDQQLRRQDGGLVRTATIPSERYLLGLIDQSQKMMVAATHIAEKNVWAGGTVVARSTRDRFDF